MSQHRHLFTEARQGRRMAFAGLVVSVAAAGVALALALYTGAQMITGAVL